MSWYLQNAYNITLKKRNRVKLTYKIINEKDRKEFEKNPYKKYFLPCSRAIRSNSLLKKELIIAREILLNRHGNRCYSVPFDTLNADLFFENSTNWNIKWNVQRKLTRLDGFDDGIGGYFGIKRPFTPTFDNTSFFTFP